MLSNFDIEEIANYYNINVIIVMKEELKNMNPINTNYIVNLESSKEEDIMKNGINSKLETINYFIKNWI